MVYLLQATSGFQMIQPEGVSEVTSFPPGLSKTPSMNSKKEGIPHLNAEEP